MKKKRRKSKANLVYAMVDLEAWDDQGSIAYDPFRLEKVPAELDEIWRKMDDCAVYKGPYWLCRYEGDEGQLFYERQENFFRWNEYRAIFHIAHNIKVDPQAFMAILESIRKGEHLYRVKYVKKKNGKMRKINVPNRELRFIQKKLGRWIMDFLVPEPNVFGFSGGSIIQAIEPHLKSRSILQIDCKNAFPSINSRAIMERLIVGRCHNVSVLKSQTQKDWSGAPFSWYGARVITDLVTKDDELPQGAPTSPKIFDLVCMELDKKLNHLAKNVGGAYTRYADNIFFSIPRETFDKKLKNAVIKTVEGKRNLIEWWRKKRRARTVSRSGPEFEWHKLRLKRTKNNAVRMLGLNMIDGRIHNTRDFKRRLRKSLHHVKWLRAHGLDHEEAWIKIQGMMQFAQIDTIPAGLWAEYQDLKNRP